MTPTTPPPAGDIERREREKEKSAKYAASSELLFVILPFIVIGITLAHRGALRTIFFLPEWSIISAVVMGQSIIRLVSTMLGRKKILKEWFLLILSVVLVIGLVPILVILSIISITEEAKVSCALASTQMMMFVISIAVYWWALFIEGHAREHPEGDANQMTQTK